MMMLSHENLPPRVGPFEITGVLGEGGMGVVYAACDAAHGQRVALKTVPHVQESLLSGLRREIHALSRLRHPGVVRVLATGIDAGRPWYAMERLEGDTLARLRNELWRMSDTLADTAVSKQGQEQTATYVHRAEPPTDTSPGSSVAGLGAGVLLRGPVAGGHLPRVLTVVRRLLTTLAFVHGEGVVHRDLKPSNVFLLPGDRPVLVDFGIASRSAGTTGREVLELSTEIVGTPAYMAPEQIQGDLVDSRADLYAVGCLFYELLTGSPPFTGATLHVMEQHLGVAPDPPSARADDVAPELDALVLALLQKRPRDRIGHAQDVIDALDELGAEREPPPTQRPRPYVYRPALAGREAALDELGRAERAARRGEGGCVLVTGASGIGKTCLVMEAARHATSFQIVAGTCAPAGTFHHGTGGQPLHPFARLFQIIADRCTSAGREETDRLLGARGKILAAHEPALARLPGQELYPDPPPLHGPAARDRLLAAIAGTLAALAEVQPLLLLLDDLQWADEVSIRLLTQLGDEWFAGKRILVLATYRTEETTPGIVELLSRPYTRQVVLSHLDRDTVRALACDMLAVDALPDSFVEFLTRHSEGNAFFIAEYLRCATAEGLLRRGGRHHVDGVGELALPLEMRELVGRRLDGLSPAARTLAAVGGVIGRELDPDVLRDAAGFDDVAAMDATSELIARQVFEQTNEGALRFSHDKLCEIAYGRLSEAQRVVYHRAVAGALERRFAEVPGLYSILAHHFVAAGVDDKALVYLDKAGAQALAQAAYGEAFGLHQKLLAIDDKRGVPDVRRRAHWERRLSEVCFNLGDLAATDRYSASAMQRLGRPVPITPGARALGIARSLGEQLLHRVGVRLGQRGGPVDTGDRLEVAIAAALMAWRYFFVEDMVGVMAMALRSVNEIEAAEPPIPLAYGYAWLGYASGIARLHRPARYYFDRAYACAAASGDMAGKHFASVMEVAYRLSFGHWDEVERLGRDALAELHAAGDPTNAELHMTGLANMMFYTGRYAESERLFEQLEVGARARRNVQHHAWGLYARSLSMVARGRFDEAEPRVVEAKQLLAPLGDTASLIICDGTLALIAARRGDDAAARRAADETRARLQKSGIGMYATVSGYVGAAEACLELADRDRGALGAARDACSDLRRFALVVPMATPAALRFHGQRLALEGHGLRAGRAFARSVAAARALRMPYDEAAALWLAARYLPAQRRGLDEAARIFEQLGCTWHLDQVAKL